MKTRWLQLLAVPGLLAMIATGCKKETNVDTVSTETSSTDTATTSSTMSATDSSGTATTSTAANTGTANATTSSLSASDKEFMTKAAIGGMAEVMMGQMASTKGTDAGVKAFGNRMVTDHSKANDELKALAQSKNITLPSEIGPEEKALRDRLMKLSGPAFDQAYMKAMVSDHVTDVNEFKMESKSGKDPEVKAWAAKTLPTLEEHLKMARDANGTVGTSGRK
jgi:putative membrane protein